MNKSKIYPYAKEVREETDTKKIASMLGNTEEEWIAMNAFINKFGELNIVLIRLK